MCQEEYRCKDCKKPILREYCDIYCPDCSEKHCLEDCWICNDNPEDC